MIRPTYLSCCDHIYIRPKLICRWYNDVEDCSTHELMIYKFLRLNAVLTKMFGMQNLLHNIYASKINLFLSICTIRTSYICLLKFAIMIYYVSSFPCWAYPELVLGRTKDMNVKYLRASVGLNSNVSTYLWVICSRMQTNRNSVNFLMWMKNAQDLWRCPLQAIFCVEALWRSNKAFGGNRSTV